VVIEVVVNNTEQIVPTLIYICEARLSGKRTSVQQGRVDKTREQSDFVAASAQLRGS
jgi:hypothetical protein